MPAMVRGLVSPGLLTPSYWTDSEQTVGWPPLTEQDGEPSLNPHKDTMNPQFKCGKKMKLREVWSLGQGPTSLKKKGTARTGAQLWPLDTGSCPLAVWSLRQVMGVSLVIRSPAHETSRQKRQHWMQEGQLALSHLTAGETEAQKGEVTQVTQSRKE